MNNFTECRIKFKLLHIITDSDTSGNDILKLTEINSKLSNNITDKLKLTKSGTDLIIQFKDDLGSIISSDKITVTNQFGGNGVNGIGSEILKKIEFADGKSIDLTNLNLNSDNDLIYSGKKTENFIANDNSKNILKIPQTELMNHH